MSLGALYVVSGPSGAGKSTVCKLVRERLGINLSISATSRKPRNGEREGVDYFFITAEDFERKIKDVVWRYYVFRSFICCLWS